MLTVSSVFRGRELVGQAFEAGILYVASDSTCCVSVSNFRAMFEDIAYVIVGHRPTELKQVTGANVVGTTLAQFSCHRRSQITSVLENHNEPTVHDLHLPPFAFLGSLNSIILIVICFLKCVLSAVPSIVQVVTRLCFA